MSARRNVTYSSRPNHAARAAHAKGDKLFRTYDTTAIKPRRSPVPAIIGIIVLLVLLGGIIFGVFNFMKGCSSTQMLEKGKQVQVVVKEGEGAKTIAKSLVDAGLISNTNEFTDRVQKLGVESKLQPGTYTLTGGQSVDDIITTLQTPVVPESFTVPEGSTIKQTAEIVAKATNGRVSADAFEKAAGNASTYASSYSFLADAGTNSLEGFLFPKTYPIEDNATADSVIRMMLDQFKSETATLDWSYPTSKGLSHYDVVKLASIIEKESDDNHRARVASVFYNRLDANMALQSDATVAYVVGHDPTADDIKIDSDYNTYQVTGLSIPTPINSPSLACLEAACSPEKTDYLYFYFESDGKGGMNYYFSETYADHQAAYGG